MDRSTIALNKEVLDKIYGLYIKLREEFNDTRPLHDTDLYALGHWKPFDSAKAVVGTMKASLSMDKAEENLYDIRAKQEISRHVERNPSYLLSVQLDADATLCLQHDPKTADITSVWLSLGDKTAFKAEGVRTSYYHAGDAYPDITVNMRVSRYRMSEELRRKLRGVLMTFLVENPEPERTDSRQHIEPWTVLRAAAAVL